jgi:hypothetical protein
MFSGTTIRWSRRGLYFLLITAFLWGEIERFVDPWVRQFHLRAHAHLSTIATLFGVSMLTAIAIYFDNVIVMLFKLSLIWLALAVWYAVSHGECNSPAPLDGIASCGMSIAKVSFGLAIYNIHHFVASIVQLIFHPPELINTHLESCCSFS